MTLPDWWPFKLAPKRDRPTIAEQQDEARQILDELNALLAHRPKESS